MKTTSATKNRCAGASAATALAVTALVLLPAFSSEAADVLKANNADSLELTTSWVAGAVPEGTDIAVWDSTVTAANSTALNADLSWQGIRVANPGGAVTINNTANLLTLGTAGIDLSAATQNLTIGTTLMTDGNQTWSLAAGRTLNLWTVNTGRGISGAHDITINGPDTGSATVVMLPGSNGSLGFNDFNSNNGFFGNWNIGPNVTVQNIRNGRTAWGMGTINLNGGTIAQVQGNWTWTNDIVLGTGTTSTIANNATGSNRSLKLQSVISGDGNLNFADTTGAMGNNTLGFIITGTNTMSGTVTIPASRFVRVGGIPGDNTSTNAGVGGTLGTAGVVNNGTLTLSHSDTWTFGNNVSGTGALVIGHTGITGTATQVATVSGTHTYTGATTVNNGRLNLTGSMTSAVTVGSAGAISGTGSTTGSMTFAGGTQIFLEGGETTTGLSSNGVTFSAATRASFLTVPVASTTYDVLTYGAGGVSDPSNLSVNAHGTLTDTGTKFTFLAAGAQARTWNAASDTWQQGVNTPWVEGDQFFYNGDSVVFGEPAAASTVTLTGQVAPASVVISNTAEPYTFSGAGMIGGATGLTKTGAGALTISSNAHNFTGNVTISGGTLNTGTAQGNGTTGFLGAVNGSRTVTIENAGTVVNFNANNQFGGAGKAAEAIPTVVIDGATLNSTRFNILGNLTLNNGATLTQSSNDGGAYEGYEFIGGTVTVGGSSASTISSNNGKANHLAGGRMTTFDVGNATSDSAADLVISTVLRNGSGDYSGAGGLIKTGAGTLELTATNTYSGETIVDAGTLLVTGSISGSWATVNAGGTLSGAGSLGNNSIHPGGTLAPGSGPGLMSAGHTIFNGGTLALELTSTESDQLLVTGSVSLTADSPLTISLGFTPAQGTVFTIIENDDIDLVDTTSGLFSFAGTALSEGAQFTASGQAFTISYAGGDGNDVVLTAVPEPSTALSLLGGLGVLLGFNRARRRRA